jgi:hypothetical protein
MGEGNAFGSAKKRGVDQAPTPGRADVSAINFQQSPALLNCAHFKQ